MGACAVFSNPYRDSLLRMAFDYGKRRRLQGQVLVPQAGQSARTTFAVKAGYWAWGWHRTPSGQVKWHGRGA